MPSDLSAHHPVMLGEVLDALSPKDGETYVDGTLGGGGYTRAILESSQCNVHAFDKDPSAIEGARRWADPYSGRLYLHNCSFCEMLDILESMDQPSVDGVALDLGVSSMQLDRPERGFSFSGEGPLDMRMGDAEFTAAQFVNQAPEKELASVIRLYGEEKFAKRIAARIAEVRAKSEIVTTSQLADCVSSAVPQNPRRKTHPATKTFQAIRILVNNELEDLWQGLLAAEKALKPAGRLVVVAFHSLEDRLVKVFFASRSAPPAKPSRYVPEKDDTSFQPSFHVPFKKPKTPSLTEVESNVRARSARMRVGIRTDFDALPGNFPGPSVEVGMMR